MPAQATDPIGSHHVASIASERAQAPAPPQAARPTIAIVGSGFSGTLLALHLLRRCPGAKVLLIERNRHFGRGLAYSSYNPGHLLNVPAGRMSAFHDRPGDFVEWLSEHRKVDRDGNSFDGESFAPRRLFGAYVRHLLNQEFKSGDPTRLELLHGEVLDIEEADRIVITLDRDRQVAAHLAILAVGNFPPEPPAVADAWVYESAWFRGDPWAPDTLTNLDPAAPVLLIGTGLTMIDTALSLIDAGHRGTIHAISRRGLIPQCHAQAASPPELGWRNLPSNVGALTRYIRDEIRSAQQRGEGWQGVIDSLRPATSGIWGTLSATERLRFLRHLRPWWEVHRHRLSHAIWSRIDEARRRGQLRVAAGRIQSYRQASEGLTVTYRPARTAEPTELAIGRIINCAGPSCDFDRVKNPLMQRMLRRGQIRADPLRLGLDISPQNALKASDGSISQRLYAVGPPTKGFYWEITSVPDIRRQCELLATQTCVGTPVGSEHQPSRIRSKGGGIPTEATVAQVLVSKFADHLPLYRQAQIYGRQGVDLDRSTLADWVGRAAFLLRPIQERLFERLKASPKLFADETTAPVLDPGRGRTKTGQLFAYVRDDRPWSGSDPPGVVYLYAPDRKAERPIAHLAGFSGVLQVDGYGYKVLARRNAVQLAFCWSHVRRRFYELVQSGPAPIATEALARIAAIYQIEGDIRGQTAEERCAIRRQNSRPLVAAFEPWLREKIALISQKTKLAEAIRYALSRWDGLSLFLDDGRIEIDNNVVERAIRPLALTRKNALFAGSDSGADHWATIASLIETCKLTRVDPQAYLANVITRIVNGHPQNRIEELLPWAYAAEPALKHVA